MVSRQESARALLTPGEVMQLPPDEEIVMVAGHPPVRARKLRYYEDRNFTRRLLPPPALAGPPYADRPAPRADDWTGRAVAVPATPSPIPPGLLGGDGDGGLRRAAELEEGLAGEGPVVTGLRIDPDDEPRDRRPSGRSGPRVLDRPPRLAALDPNDGIPL